jgi:hypothetical protein
MLSLPRLHHFAQQLMSAARSRPFDECARTKAATQKT